jgi:hypothetical protein
MNRIFLLLAVAVMTFGCKTKTGENNTKATTMVNWNPPPAGTIVDQYEEKVTEDKINDIYFRVIIKTTDSSKYGHFAVTLERGGNKNETDIDLPKWYKGAILKPVIKKGTNPYECFLGFDAGDGIFKGFYQIKVDEKKSIVMKQIVGYYQ